MKPPVAHAVKLWLVPRRPRRDGIPAVPAHPDTRPRPEGVPASDHEASPRGDAVEALVGQGIPGVRLVGPDQRVPQGVVAEAPVARRQELKLDAGKHLTDDGLADAASEGSACPSQGLNLAKGEVLHDHHMELRRELNEAVVGIGDCPPMRLILSCCVSNRPLLGFC